MSPASASIRVSVNDLPRELQRTATVSALLADLGLAGRNGIAVAVNGTVVARAGWQSRQLSEGDRVLVIEATQGG